MTADTIFQLIPLNENCLGGVVVGVLNIQWKFFQRVQ